MATFTHIYKTFAPGTSLKCWNTAMHSVYKLIYVWEWQQHPHIHSYHIVCLFLFCLCVLVVLQTFFLFLLLRALFQMFIFINHMQFSCCHLIYTMYGDIRCEPPPFPYYRIRFISPVANAMKPPESDAQYSTAHCSLLIGHCK